MPSKTASLAERGGQDYYASNMAMLWYMNANFLNYSRHDSKSGNGRANLLYSDGHVGSLTYAAACAIKKDPAGSDNLIFQVGYNN